MQVEMAFLLIYCFELLVRICAHGWQNLRDAWFVSDVVLVVVGLVGLTVEKIATNGADDTGLLQQAMIVRTFRLLRVIRAFRMIFFFNMMWRLVYGMIRSAHTMFSTLLLLAFSLFVFTYIGIELVSQDEAIKADPEAAAVVEQHFSSMLSVFMALSQFISMDSAGAIYTPLIRAKPVLSLYFISLFIIIPVALMNLVTAILVENCMDASAEIKREDQEKLKTEVKKILPAILRIFRSLDLDGNGRLNKKELAHVPLETLPAKLLEKVSVDSVHELFDVLDVEGTGNLSQSEFLEGILEIATMDVPIQTIQILKQLHLVRNQLKDLAGNTQARVFLIPSERGA